MRILVVEDDANLNRQIKDALTEGGYAVDMLAGCAHAFARGLLGDER